MGSYISIDEKGILFSLITEPNLTFDFFFFFKPDIFKKQRSKKTIQNLTGLTRLKSNPKLIQTYELNLAQLSWNQACN